MTNIHIAKVRLYSLQKFQEYVHVKWGAFLIGQLFLEIWSYFACQSTEGDTQNVPKMSVSTHGWRIADRLIFWFGKLWDFWLWFRSRVSHCLRQLSIVLASWLNYLSPRQPIIEIEYEKWLEDNHNVSALRMVSLWLSNLPRGCSVCSLWYMDAWGIALPPWRRVATGKVFRNMVTGEKNLGLLNSLPPSDIVINRLSDLLAFPKGKPFPLYLNTFLS